MKRLIISAALLLVLFATSARAEKPILTNGVGTTGAVSLGEVKATPEMWFYDQAMRQYQDPKMAVRVKADYHAQQRMKRLESMKWFGFSNIRPRASSDPFSGDYSPNWVSHPGYYPSRWNGVSQP